jgi:hypothetical protein
MRLHSGWGGGVRGFVLPVQCVSMREWMGNGLRRVEDQEMKDEVIEDKEGRQEGNAMEKRC